MNPDSILFKLISLVPSFFKNRYKALKRFEYFIVYLILHCMIFSIYLFVFIISLNDQVSLFLIKRWYSSVLFLIFFIIYLYVFLSKPKMDYLFTMEDTFNAYGKTMHTPGNINFHEIKNLVERSEIIGVFKGIDLKLKDLNKRAVLILGEPASGKTSIALSVGYSFWNNGFNKQVFYWNLNNNKGRKNIEDSFSCLINDIKKNHREIVLIIEDIHNNIDIFENRIIPLINSNKNLITILTSRNIGIFESIEESSKQIYSNPPKMKFNRKKFANFGEDKIIEIKSDLKFINMILKAYGLNSGEIDYNLAKNKSGNDFNLVILDLLIAITLEAKKKGIVKSESKINKTEIYRFIEDKIETIWKSLKDNNYSKIDFLNILFIVSTFSMFEFPIEIPFIKNYTKSDFNDSLFLDTLVESCEFYQVKSQKNIGYILPHSKYAEIINETIINRFNIDLSGEDLLFDYFEKGEKIVLLLTILMNEVRFHGGFPGGSMSDLKNATKLSEIINKDPIKFQRVNLGNFKLNEINQLFDEIEYISPELTKDIIQYNLNNLKKMHFERFDLKTINIFLRYLQRCPKETRISIIDHYKNYFLGDNFTAIITKNDVATIASLLSGLAGNSNNVFLLFLNKFKGYLFGIDFIQKIKIADITEISSFISSLAFYAEEICLSFIEINVELLKNKCRSPNARELTHNLCIFITSSEKINNTILDRVFKEKIEEIFRSDMLNVLRFLDWDFWIPKGDVLLEIIKKYLKSENLRQIILESDLNNIGKLFLYLICLRSTNEMVIDIFIHFESEIVEKIKKSDSNEVNKFSQVFDGNNKFNLFFRSRDAILKLLPESR